MSDLRERYDFLFDGRGDLTQETLLLYVFGPLENGARDAVEQHVEQCEMCRDAAEGMALLGTKEQALAALVMADAKLLERVEQLKQKVTSSGREALIKKAAINDHVVLKTDKPMPRIAWYRYAAAASVLVMIGVAFWFVNFSINKDLTPLSMNQADSLVLINEQKGMVLEKDKAKKAVNAETAPDSGTFSVSGSAITSGSAYKWDTNASVSTDKEGVSPTLQANTYSVPATDTKPNDVTAASEEIADELVAMEDREKEAPAVDGVLSQSEAATTNAPAPTAPAPTDDESKKAYEEWYGAKDRTASRKSEPVHSKGTGNSNFNMNNAADLANSDVSVYQAQYPGGSTEVQKYFDKIDYPKEISKGYKGIMVFEVNFNKKGKITNATIVSGLGEPYDKMLLDHLKKMPDWTPPSPEGEPFESVRMVTVEVTVR